MLTKFRKLLLNVIKIFIVTTAIWTVMLGLSVFAWEPSSAEGVTAPYLTIHTEKQRSEEVRIQRIYRTVRKMVQNPALLSRIEEKLRTFDREKLKLIDTLCIRIAENPDDPSADIAFLLVTGLIIT